jgi:hypothetical protein
MMVRSDRAARQKGRMWPSERVMVTPSYGSVTSHYRNAGVRLGPRKEGRR